MIISHTAATCTGGSLPIWDPKSLFIIRPSNTSIFIATPIKNIFHQEFLWDNFKDGDKSVQYKRSMQFSGLRDQTLARGRMKRTLGSGEKYDPYG